MDTTCKILDVETGIEIAKDWPAIDFSKQLFDFRKKRSPNSKGGFLGIYSHEELAAILPINYYDKELYSLLKTYSEPFIIKGNAKITWGKIADWLLKSGFDYVEFNLAPIKTNKSDPIFSRTQFSTYILEIKENEVEVLKKIDKKTRNQLLKAQKAGFEVRIMGEEIIPKFFELYLENMARHGTPPRGIDYFKDLAHSFKEGFVCFAAFKEKKLAGINLAIIANSNLRLLFNISDKNFWPFCVNDLLYWETICWSIKNKIKIIDFGGGPDSDVGHNHFKLGFGARGVPIYKYSKGKISNVFYFWLRKKIAHLKILINR